MNRSTVVFVGLLAALTTAAPALASAPAPTVTAPTGDVNTATPTLAGTAGNASGDSDSVMVTVTRVGAGSQNFNVVRNGTLWQRTFVAAEALPDGRYSTTVSQSNMGQVGMATLPFRVDTQAPVVTLNAVTSPGSDDTPTFSGTKGGADGTGDASADGLVAVAITSKGALVQTLDATGALGDYSATAAHLPDGTYTAFARQSDGAGNPGFSEQRTFVVDTTPPVVTLAVVPDTNVTKPIFKGTAEASENNSDKLAVVLHSGETVAGGVVQTVDGGVTHEDSWEAPTAIVLAPGTYTAEATQTDGAGNVGRSTPRTFTVDTMAPTVTLVSPGDGASTGDPTPTVTVARGTDPRDLPPVTVSLSRGSRVITCTVPAGVASCDAADALDEGDWTVTAAQSDGVGNTATTAGRTLHVDLTAPRLTIDAPAAGATTTDRTPTISGTTSTDPGDGSFVHLTIGAVTLDAPVTAGHWSVDAATLDPGAIRVQGTYSDGVGHAVTAERKFTVTAEVQPVGKLTIKLKRAARKAARKALRKGRVSVGITITPADIPVTLTGRLLLDARTAKEAGIEGEKVKVHHNPFVIAQLMKPTTGQGSSRKGGWNVKANTAGKLIAQGHFTLVLEVTATAKDKKPVKSEIRAHYDLKANVKV